MLLSLNMPTRQHEYSDSLRQLGAPKRISVEPDERGRPRAVFRERGQRWIRVASIQDFWRIDDEWWTFSGEISRMYFLVELQGAQLMTVYRDLTTGYWYEQRVSAPLDVPAPIDVFAEPAREDGSASLVFERFTRWDVGGG
jgi:hypothetical protein